LEFIISLHGDRTSYVKAGFFFGFSECSVTIYPQF